jgi:hypothetical protein
MSNVKIFVLCAGWDKNATELALHVNDPALSQGSVSIEYFVHHTFDSNIEKFYSFLFLVSLFFCVSKKKRKMTFSAIVTLFVVIVASGCLHIAHAQKSLSIYVSPMLGLDTNAGTTSSAPLRTLRAAGLLIQSQPQVVYSISISIDTGIYTNAQDCEFELTALSIGVPLTVTGNGTVFRCAQMSSSAVSVQARIAGFANVSISGLVWSDLQLTCVAWPCAALLVDAADRVIIHDVNVSNVSLVVPNADDAWNLVSPLAINATGAVFIDDAHFEHNSLLVNVSTSNNDAFFFRVGGGAIAVVSEWFALGQATFDTNAVESLTAGRVIGGGAVLIDDKAKKIDVADCVFVNNSVRSDGAAIGGVIAVRSCDTAVDASVEMRVNNSLFDNNHLWSSDSSAQFQGVAIAGVQCGVVAAKSLVALVMDSTRFVGNSIVASGADAQATGGIVRVHSLHATNCSVTNTSLLGVGNVNGGFVALQGVSSVSSCTFDNNVFESNNVNGALVKIDDDDGHVCTGSDMFTFIDNVVTNTAINDTLSLPGGIVCGSSPTGGGGVIRIDLVRCRTDVVNIQGGVFANNNLKYCTGGAVSITGGDISFMGVLVANNTARAGAVFEGHLLSSVDIDSSQFENNTANRVGGVGSFYDVTFLAVHNNTFTKNSAGDRGSVFYFEAVASVVIDGSSMVENTDAFNTSVHFVSLHPMLISVKGKWLGNGILVHGPVKELLVGDSLFVDSPIYVTYDFGTFVHSSLYRFVDSTFQGGSTIVVTDSGDRTQAAAVLQIALTLLNCRFLIDDHLTMNVARGCVTVTSVLTHTSVQNCTFIGTGTGALAPLFIMQNEIATLSMTNCALERTASIVAHSSIVLTNVTFDSCNGVLWAVSVPIISMQSVAIRNALHGSMVRFIDVATADQVQITNVSIANSSANSKVLRLINVKILDVYGLTVSNTTLRDPMSSVVQLSNVSSIYAFQDVAIVNNTFSVGALMLDNIKMLLGRNVTLANNTATVCGGAAFVDDIATLKNLSLTASDNRALCFGNGTIFAPVRIQLVGGGAVVKAMRGVAARITAQLVDPFNVSTPDCAQPVRTLPVNVHAYIGSNSPDTTLCTIPRNSSWCTGSLWFDGDVGESTSVTLKINSLADFLFHAIEPATFQLVVADCMAGFAMQNGRCVECQSASYSFGGMASCRSCPLDAVCRGGSAFESANDTFVAWNANSSDVEVHRCLLGVCGGGAVASNLTVVNHCAPGRTGLLCASCEQQRNASFAPVAPSGGGAACIECNGTNVPVVVALVVAVLFSHCPLSSTMSAHSSSANTKLLFYYAQIASIVLPSDFPSDVVTHVLNMRVGAATACVRRHLCRQSGPL